MSHDLIEAYERYLREKLEADERVAKAKAHYDAAKAEAKAVDSKLDHVKGELKRAIDIAGEMPVPPSRTPERAPAPVESRVRPPRVPKGITPALWAIVRVIPVDGDATTKEIRDANPDVSKSNMWARLSKAKAADLIESVGHARYQLTDKARKLRVQRLHVVGGNNGEK